MPDGFRNVARLGAVRYRPDAMIQDFAASPPDPFPEYDVCIVGSGPAGITVANELRDTGLRICVLESGRFAPTAAGDALRRVVSEGIVIKEWSRERVVGGASSTWAGLSSPLDPIDLAPRPWLARSGWPFGPEALAPYYAAAAARYRFPPLAAFTAAGFARLRDAGDLRPGWERLQEKVFLAAVPPQHFGREFGAVFGKPAVDLWIDATVLRLEAAGPRQVDAAVVRASTGVTRRVRAGTFVLAGGGIENARLLLASTDRSAAGLGNEHDQVGRCLMNHPKDYHGVIRLARPVRRAPYWFGCIADGFAGYGGLRLCDDLQAREGLLNAYVRFEPLFPWSDNPGVEALVALVKRSRFLLARFTGRPDGEVVELRDWSETGDDSELQNRRRRRGDAARLLYLVVAHLPGVLRYLWYRLAARARPRVRQVRLRNFMEMEPDPANRVVLGDARDAYGERAPVVRHRSTARDRRSLVALHAVLADEVARAGVGELATSLATADPWPVDQDASHHLGTTRMGTDPRESVVDADLRLHSVENVYVTGGSVFPTSGSANPTFTIVALAIRLAEHLRARRPAAARVEERR